MKRMMIWIKEFFQELIGWIRLTPEERSWERFNDPP